MNTPMPAAAFSQRISRKKHAGGSRLLALIFILLGLGVFLFYHWIIGLLIMLASALVDARHLHISLCGKCGNEVANTSKLCPVCSAKLSAPEKQDLLGLSRLLYAGILIALAIHAHRWIQQHPEMFHWLKF